MFHAVIYNYLVMISWFLFSFLFKYYICSLLLLKIKKHHVKYQEMYIIIIYKLLIIICDSAIVPYFKIYKLWK